jgi:hypothetical protein
MRRYIQDRSASAAEFEAHIRIEFVPLGAHQECRLWATPAWRQAIQYAAWHSTPTPPRTNFAETAQAVGKQIARRAHPH